MLDLSMQTQPRDCSNLLSPTKVGSGALSSMKSLLSSVDGKVSDLEQVVQARGGTGGDKEM